VQLYLIRHPQPEIEAGICYGRSDLPLRTPWTAETLRERLPAGASVISSPLQRCASFASALSPDFRTDGRLTELDFGAWEMQAWDRIPREQIDAWTADPLGFNGHGGESVAQMQLRVRQTLADLDGGDCGACVWVTHAGVMKLVLAELLGLPQDEWLSLRFAHAEITLLEQVPGKPSESRWSLQGLR
jgi:alpha-ribazole phosphatase